MARLPTATAIRSTRSAEAGSAKIKQARATYRMSKSLTYGEEELEMTGVLLHRCAEARQRTLRQVGVALHQLLHRAVEADKRRRVNAVRQVESQRAHGRSVADAEADGVHHVVEVLEVVLPH